MKHPNWGIDDLSSKRISIYETIIDMREKSMVSKTKEHLLYDVLSNLYDCAQKEKEIYTCKSEAQKSDSYNFEDYRFKLFMLLYMTLSILLNLVILIILITRLR